MPVVDRDEARFAQASRQMLESFALPREQRDTRPIARDEHGRLSGGLHAGGFVVPMLVDRPRLNKPPMIYWLQAGCAYAFTIGRVERDAIWMYRVPSLVAALTCVVLTYWLGTMMSGSRVGFYAAGCVAVCPVFAWEGHQARADMVLVAATLVAMMALWKAYSTSLHDGDKIKPNKVNVMWVLTFWIAIGFGILTKGPITPMVAALAVVVACVVHRRVRWLLGLQPWWGVAVVAAMVGPWVLAVGDRVGWDLYIGVVLDETLGRSVSAKEGHWGPPGYHSLLVVLLLWPASLAVVHGLATGWQSVRSRAAAGATFATAWIVPSWIVFELVGTKLPHYTMPLYPAVAILAVGVVVSRQAMATQTGDQGSWRWFEHVGVHSVRVWRIIGLVVCAGPVVGLTAMMASDAAWRSEIAWASLAGAWVLAVVAAALVLRGARLASRDKPTATLALGIAAGCAASIATIGFVLPSVRPLWISDELGRAIREADPSTQRPVGTVKFHEDSLIYHTRGRVVRLSEEDESAWWQAHPDGMLVIPASRILRSYNVLARANGINYSRGQRVELALVTRWYQGPPGHQESSPAKDAEEPHP